ncbi:hypothetical protein CYMTET_50201 [Cymbomonas tetramitiformis]|uniref:Phytocyanin domain-containing protein n=1 Tax=Cymbomonas tetramitiformis TaxID=36881 RepID=A0AAE0ET29_9CHLO|nr:hypothetical protein CYMTET_50201 [Cymbomonas tetramitiformis]
MAVGADGASAWTTGIDYADIICPYNGQVLFNWTSPYHDVVQMRDSTTFEECDFAESTVLADSAHDSYVFDCDTPGEYFLSCSMYEGQHCQNKQKVKIHVTDPKTTDDLPLSGHMTLASAEALIRDGYYTTEPDYTVERLWCVPSHCPVSAYDWDIASTNETCWAEVYNLLGFAHRKMPDPDYEHSEKYYLDALALVPDHCGALGYLTELYVTLDRTEEADETYLKLCDACGANHSSTIEVNGWYDDNGATPPASECSSTPSSDSASPPPDELAVSDIAGLDNASSAEYQSFTAELLQTTAAALSVSEDSVAITSFEVSSNPETSLRRAMLATTGAVSVEFLVVSSLDASEAQAKVEEKLPEVSIVETVTSTTATTYTATFSPPPTEVSTDSSDDSAANALGHKALIGLLMIGMASFMGMPN